MTYKITMPIPPLALRPNGRSHWRVKAKATKLFRGMANLRMQSSLGKDNPPKWGKAVIQFDFYFKTVRFLDPDNAVASCKAIIDGIADSGIIGNDRHMWPLRPTMQKDAKNPRLEITVMEEKE